MQSIAEVWKDIQGYEGLYQVSNLGRVKSLGRFIESKLKGIDKVWKAEKILKPLKKSDGYLNVRLYKDGKWKIFLVHRLVAIAFIPNTENKPYIDHVNTIRVDNTEKNLRWVTAKENAQNILTIEHLKNKKVSEETKRKISARLSGKNHPMFGKKHSEETKEKLRGANNPTSRKVRNLNTNEIFCSVTDAGKKYGVTDSAIRASIKKNRKSAGYHWEYL